MCGDLDEYDPGKHHELIINHIRKQLGEPTISGTKNWARDIANLDLEVANKELLSHFIAMEFAISSHKVERERLESLAQMAQIHAYLSGIFTGVLLDDGTLQQIGLQKFLEGIRVGRLIEANVSDEITHGHHPNRGRTEEHHSH